MDHWKKVEWEVLVIDDGRSQRPQKSWQKSYRSFSQINSIFRLLLLSEPLKVRVHLSVFLYELAEMTKESTILFFVLSKGVWVPCHTLYIEALPYGLHTLQH